MSDSNFTKIHLFVVLCLSFLFTPTQSVYKLFKHPADTAAKCVDGTPSALYIQQGQSDKILLYFEGGGMCNGKDLSSTIQNCYQRSKTALGSSKDYKEQVDLNGFTIMSNERIVNPLYFNWTKVYIPYCDGVLHQGTKQASIPYKNVSLYFRGMNITLAHIQYLDKVYNLLSAQKVVLSGTSAGAMAALAWSNHVYKRMKNPSGLLVIFDSGQFVSDYFNPFTNSTPGTDYFVAIKKLAFTQVLPPFKQCLAAETRENCDKFGVIVNYVLPPIFAIESQYDLYAIRQILLLSCPQKSFPASLQKCNQTQLNVIEDYRQKSLNSLANLTKHEKNGLWAISCSQHGFLYFETFYNSNFYKVPQTTGQSILHALENYLIGNGSRVTVDAVNWPHNSPCSGVTNQNLKIE